MNYHTIKVAEICDNTKTREEGAKLYTEVQKYFRINQGVEVDFSGCNDIGGEFIRRSVVMLFYRYGERIFNRYIKINGETIEELLNMGTI